MTPYPPLHIPWGFRRILRVSVLQHMRGNLSLERIWVNRHVQHAYDIHYPALLDADRTTLEAFFVTCRGKYLGDISFPDPWDGLNYTCRLDNDELLITIVLPSYWSTSVKLLEVSGFKAVKSPITSFPVGIPNPCDPYPVASVPICD